VNVSLERQHRGLALQVAAARSVAHDEKAGVGKLVHDEARREEERSMVLLRSEHGEDSRDARLGRNAARRPAS
jgi:hypothetical protein